MRQFLLHTRRCDAEIMQGTRLGSGRAETCRGESTAYRLVRCCRKKKGSASDDRKHCRLRSAILSNPTAASLGANMCCFMQLVYYYSERAVPGSAEINCHHTTAGGRHDFPARRQSETRNTVGDPRLPRRCLFFLAGKGGGGSHSPSPHLLFSFVQRANKSAKNQT